MTSPQKNAGFQGMSVIDYQPEELRKFQCMVEVIISASYIEIYKIIKNNY